MAAMITIWALASAFMFIFMILMPALDANITRPNAKQRSVASVSTSRPTLPVQLTTAQSH